MSTVLSATGPKRCIICLQHASTMVPLGTEVDIDGVAMNCETMYGKFIGIQYETATLAKKRLLNLCLGCLTQLNSSYLFQRQAIESAESIFGAFTASQEQPTVGADNLLVQYFSAPKEESNDQSETSQYLEEANVIEKTFLDPSSALVYPSDEEGATLDEIETELEEAEELTADEALLSMKSDPAEDNEQQIEQTVPEATEPSCNECTRLKDDVLLFRKHFLRTHCLTKAGDWYQCTVCMKHFKSMRSFVRHARTHQGAKRFACQFCAKSFHYSHHLLAHERIHTNEKPFACGKCTKAFVSKERLRVHEETHSAGFDFECKVCRARFKTRQNLYKHCLIKHDRPVAKFQSRKCEQCDKVMLSQSAVTYHRQHSCVANQQASHQQQTALSVQDQTNHLKNPTNRKYDCDVCGTQFSQRIELNRHKLIHEGTRPYRCDVCDRTFRQKGTLTTHMRTHTDEKPYECTHCAVRFRSAASRRSHFIRQHANDGSVAKE